MSQTFAGGAVEHEPSDVDARAGAAWETPPWDEVVLRYADQVYRYAYRLTGNKLSLIHI